jgi:hypothetical protein
MFTVSKEQILRAAFDSAYNPFSAKRDREWEKLNAEIEDAERNRRHKIELAKKYRSDAAFRQSEKDRKNKSLKPCIDNNSN